MLIVHIQKLPLYEAYSLIIYLKYDDIRIEFLSLNVVLVIVFVKVTKIIDRIQVSWSFITFQTNLIQIF